MKRLFVMMSLLGVIIFSACNSSEDIVGINNKNEVGVEHFTFTTESYGADEVTTRTAKVITPATQTIDIGDGLEAEVSIKQDAIMPHSRASQPLSDGHYTIYAIDATTQTRVNGADSKVSGTVTGGVFTRDSGTKLKLNPGTYSFVCFNDAVIDNGTSLSVTNGKDALIGVTTETISGDTWTVNFMMKHQTARVRFCISSYMPTSGFNTQLKSQSGSINKLDYNVDCSAITSSSTGLFTENNIVPISTTPPTGQLFYSATTDYHYLVPGNAGSSFVLSATNGTLYDVALTGKTLPISNWTTSIQRGHSYTVVVKITRPGRYLYQDGSTGDLAYKGLRTPIGLVVTKKTPSTSGLAIALKTIYSVSGYNAFTSDNDNSTIFNNFAGAWNDMDGYKYTWEASGSSDGTTIKAEDATKHPVFYAAGHFDPGIATSNIGRWFLGSLGQWKSFFASMGANVGSITNYGSLSCDFSTINAYFTAAGGDPLNSMWQHTSTGVRYSSSTLRQAAFQRTGNSVFFLPQYTPNFDIKPFVYF